jgi:hypothetical protein
VNGIEFASSSFFCLTQEDRWRDDSTDWKTLSDNDILLKYAMDGSDVRYTN